MDLNSYLMGNTDDNDLVNSDLVTPPNVTGQSDNVNVIVNPKAKVDNDLQVPDHVDNVQLTLVKNGVAKVIEMKEVEKDILAAESISKSDAKAIFDLFGKPNKISLEEYSNTKTLTNYKFTVAHMKTMIATEEEKLTNNFEHLIQGPFRDCINFNTAFLDNIYSLRYVIDDFKYRTTNHYNDILKNPDLVIPSNGEFINIVKVTLDKVNLNDINKIKEEDKKLFMTSVCNLSKTLDNRTVNYFLINNKFDLEEFAKHIPNKEMCLKDIVNYLVSLDHIETIDLLVRTITQNIKNLESIAESVPSTDKINTEYIDSFLINNQQVIETNALLNLRCIEVYNGINNIVMNIRNIMETLKLL